MWRVGSKIPINVYDGDRPVCQCQTAVDARNRLVALDPPSPYTGAAHIDVARNEWFSLFEVAQQVTRDVKYGKDIRLAFGAELLAWFRLAEIDKRIRREMIGIYGDPAYGSWPDSAADYKAKRFAELDQPGALFTDARESAARDTQQGPEISPEPETPFDLPRETK